MSGGRRSKASNGCDQRNFLFGSSSVVGKVVDVISALSPTSPEIARHRNIGMSTGYMSDHYGQWLELVSEATRVSTTAVELSALSESELPSLIEFIRETPALPFLFVSVHAPTKGREMPEQELVEMLRVLANRVDAIVVHPDVMEEPDLSSIVAGTCRGSSKRRWHRRRRGSGLRAAAGRRALC